MRSKVAACVLALLLSSPALSATGHSSTAKHDHDAAPSAPPLTMPGNAAFGAIQEVIARLNADPETDWRKIDLEALRQHLLDMRDMTVNVEVVAQQPVPKGARVVVEPTTPRANEALQRVLAAHPDQLQREAGWTMSVNREGDRYVLTTTTQNPDEISKIRGLGYIGLMAYGSHHKAHHWAIATGESPHAGHR